MKDSMRRRDALLKKFIQCSDFVRGSVNSVCASCNRAGCICEKKTSGKAYRLTYKDSRQKTQIVYIPHDRLPEIRRLMAHYSISRKIIEQLIEANVAAFKKGARC